MEMKAFFICFGIVCLTSIVIWAACWLMTQWAKFMLWLIRQKYGWQLSLLMYMLLAATVMWLMGVGQL